MVLGKYRKGANVHYEHLIAGKAPS